MTSASTAECPSKRADASRAASIDPAKSAGCVQKSKSLKSATKANKSAKKSAKKPRGKIGKIEARLARAKAKTLQANKAVQANKSRQAHLRVFAAGQPVPKGGGIYRVGDPYVIGGRTYTPHADKNYRAEGKASWYGSSFHGLRTANGENFDMHALSAAHPTLPLPSYVRVTNLENNTSLVVRLNDRGPYRGGRLIDLSVRAAKLLGFYDQGLAQVRVEYVGRAELAGSDDEILAATLRRDDVVQVAASTPVQPDRPPAKVDLSAFQPAQK